MERISLRYMSEEIGTILKDGDYVKGVYFKSIEFLLMMFSPSSVPEANQVWIHKNLISVMEFKERYLDKDIPFYGNSRFLDKHEKEYTDRKKKIDESANAPQPQYIDKTFNVLNFS